MPSHPTTVEFYRAALSRITPTVGASFACVFLRDEGDPSLLRVACAQNWPQSSARFLGDLRIREGRGPTGRAFGSGTAVQVADIFDDPSLRDWWVPAREIGFVSMIALPLTTNGRVVGAASFYFAERQDFEGGADHLLSVVEREIADAPDRVGVSPFRSAPARE
jgi:GAF domain-containing protein